MRKKLKITIGTEGDAEIDVEGFQGRECLAVTRDIEAAIGEVTDRDRKSSFYRQGSRRRHRSRD